MPQGRPAQQAKPGGAHAASVALNERTVHDASSATLRRAAWELKEKRRTGSARNALGPGPQRGRVQLRRSIQLQVVRSQPSGPPEGLSWDQTGKLQSSDQTQVSLASSILPATVDLAVGNEMLHCIMLMVVSSLIPALNCVSLEVTRGSFLTLSYREKNRIISIRIGSQTAPVIVC